MLLQNELRDQPKCKLAIPFVRFSQSVLIMKLLIDVVDTSYMMIVYFTQIGFLAGWPQMVTSVISGW